ncbi:tyrosine-type recombinase/integrase [Ammoniphilus resinae]|uniref:Integrase/recombinase XerD n=1 Tax=Ammoniphilus resinae TaxID=861532 RepID=A0ABS4GX61_9BACL|nr:tyrosine-type recombinase/integrase [Ammoniphilus resinae]MBP1934859.1 integrase/recombinase XerD [Ammoniphilus resinae]
MQKLGSMKYQVESALKVINYIGQSKHEAKKKIGSNKVTGIYSIKYFRKVLGSSILFSQFAKREFKIKSIFELQPEHHAAYIDELQQKEVTKGYLTNVESHLLKLQTAMRLISEKNHRKPVTFMEKRLISWKDKEKPKDRSYTEEEIQKLEPHFSRAVATAMRMSLNLGFRTVTICNIRVEHVVTQEDGSLRIEIPDGKGITKGGRFLYLNVSSSYAPELIGLIKNKGPKDKILPLKENTLRQGLKRACEASGVESAGFHGFRHTYARRRLEQIMGDRFTEGKIMIDYILKNRDRGRRMDDGISKDPLDPYRKSFEWVQDCVNIVHGELGHGKSRWALVAVYMS